MTAAEGVTAVSVTDRGPGIAPEQRDKVGRRFYRIPGNDESGSGPGHSIVKRIAELHHATVSLGDGEGAAGLQVAVTFPS